MLKIPASYEDSRTRFCGYLPSLKKVYPAPQLESRQIPHPDDDDLTIDILHADASERKERLFVLSTGLHGIEGYVGAVMMQLFVEEYLPKFDPATTGVLLIHAINPWGMKNRRRVNPNNVDLNRNFNTDTSKLAEINPSYKHISPFLNPQKPLNNHIWAQISFLGGVISNLLKYSVSSIREATLMGQYHTPHGIYHGGADLQPEANAVMDILRTHLDGYPQIVHLDMHTGYGPRYGMTLVNSTLEAMNAQQTATKFNYARVAATNPEEFYTIHGDMMDFVYQIASDKKVYAAAFEFGTYGDSLWDAIHSLRSSIVENQVFQHGGSDAAKAWVKKEYTELFMPAEEAWLQKAIEDAQQAFAGILGAEGYIA
jgi:predicted deacylase